MGIGVHWTEHGPCWFGTRENLGRPAREKLTQWPCVGVMSLLRGLAQGQGPEPERERGGGQLGCSSSQLGRVPDTCTRTSDPGQSYRERPTI